jgi:hypothetical protein
MAYSMKRGTVVTGEYVRELYADCYNWHNVIYLEQLRSWACRKHKQAGPLGQYCALCNFDKYLEIQDILDNCFKDNDEQTGTDE